MEEKQEATVYQLQRLETVNSGILFERNEMEEYSLSFSENYSYNYTDHTKPINKILFMMS